MEILTDEDCWELLAGQQVGRLAVAVSGRPDIFPVNYVVDSDRLVFRTAEGSKLAAVVVNSIVAFEVDGLDEATNEAWSVVLYGRARVLRDEAEEVVAENLPLFPWHAAPKAWFIEIDPVELSGRLFVAEGRR